jgi:hypothetical protein
VRRVGFVMLLCALAIVGACGKKGPPRPPAPPGLPAIQDLRAVVEGGTVRLTWKLPTRSEGLAGFVIERSGPENATCPDCPRSYVEIRKLPAETEVAGFEAVDENLPGKGWFFYRVIPYDVKGRKGAESNEAAATVE